MNCTTTNVVIGNITATKLGISSPVNSKNTASDKPRLTTSSMNRSDCVSQISATSPPVTATSAISNCRRI